MVLENSQEILKWKQGIENVFLNTFVLCSALTCRFDVRNIEMLERSFDPLKVEPVYHYGYLTDKFQVEALILELKANQTLSLTGCLSPFLSHNLKPISYRFYKLYTIISHIIRVAISDLFDHNFQVFKVCEFPELQKGLGELKSRYIIKMQFNLK